MRMLSSSRVFFYSLLSAALGLRVTKGNLGVDQGHTGPKCGKAMMGHRATSFCPISMCSRITRSRMRAPIPATLINGPLDGSASVPKHDFARAIRDSSRQFPSGDFIWRFANRRSISGRYEPTAIRRTSRPSRKGAYRDHRG